MDMEHRFRKELASLEISLLDEIKQRDAIIKSLKMKFVESSTNDNAPSYADVASTNVKKVEHDLLVIGDSLIKHLDGEVINPGGETTIACHPGARPDKIASEFRQLAAKNTYKKIIVHVGSNLIPRYSTTFVADKIVACMEVVKQLAPKAKIAFSTVLPKWSNRLLPGIDEVNRRAIGSGRAVGYGYVDHCRFMTNRRGVDPSLFWKDGIHLSDKGKAAFHASFTSFIKLN